MQTTKPGISTTRRPALLAVMALNAACAANLNLDETQSLETIEQGPPGPGDRAAYHAVRRTAGAAQGLMLYARSVHVDPLNRPVSNGASLASLVLKSGIGLLRRLALGTVALPALEQTPIPAVANTPGMDLVRWEKRLDRLTGRQSSLGQIRYLVGGEEYFERLYEAVDNAEESIDIRTYIFDNDDYAVALADFLKEKSRSVRVRVLLDGLGSLQAMQVDPASMPIGHKAPLSMTMYLEQGSSVQVRTRANPYFTGDHTKSTIIDGRVAFVGGMNIGREYRYEWHDLMLEVTGPIVDRLQHDSDKAWTGASVFGDLGTLMHVLTGKKKRAADEGYPVRVLYTRNFDSQIYRAQLEAIRRAQNRIYIENAYFADDTVLFELVKARRRGVDVRVILPTKGNHGILNASNNVAINTMIENGIRVYRYPGMTHVKAAVYDGWACVGSANFDKLSLEINKELNLATSHPAAVDELMQKVFIPDLARSEEVLSPMDVSLADRLKEIAVDEAL